MYMKTCSVCVENKELSEFHRMKNSKDGYRGQCKECRIKITKEYREANKEHLKEIAKAYYSDNKVELQIKQREYYKNNIESSKASHMKYRSDNKEKYHKPNECECGGAFKLKHKSTHLKTSKHIDYLHSLK